MSDKTQSIKSYQIVYPQIYSYRLPDIKQNEGSQKIGYTERKNVDDRIKEQTQTAAIRLKYEKLWSMPAFFEGGKESFTDKDFHRFLQKNGIENRTDLGTEWFYFNGFPDKSKELLYLFRKERFGALQNNKGKIDYKLRPEQEDAVTKALEYFENNEKGEFLWNAKPRFGKTLASYDLAKRLGANKVLIVTNRPAIANSWYDDFEKFIDGYTFISETSSLSNRGALTRKDYLEQKLAGKPLITFLSLQDLKGSKYFGGNYDKLDWVADLPWDLLIIDEAHEGVDTIRTDAAFTNVKRKNTLHLSGTPFKALANEKFPADAIYNWTYLDEQQMKQAEINEGETGPHTDLPDLKLFTYRISQMTAKQVNEGVEIDDKTRDYAFDLNEFFRTEKQKFVYEDDVREFLHNLTTNKKYPFSTPKLRNELKHTFWYVGNRVDSVKALAKLLKEVEAFKDYEVVIAAGDGRSFEEEEADFKANESSFAKVKKAIAENDKTITLSCGQLTTGVTVKEWTAVLMLTDIKAPAVYMQAAFRAQNPFKEQRGDELYVKKSAYLFDFAPTRVLEIYDKFANGLNPKAVKGEITEKEREENIKQLLNFFPVISEDVNGEMIELDAEKVLTFPNALAAIEIVNARFMTNLLFNDSLKGVFNFPREVEEILDKLPEEKNKRIQKPNHALDLDDAKKVNNDKEMEINRNTGVILGEKIFRNNVELKVENLLEQNKEKINAADLMNDMVALSEPLIATYKEVYKTTEKENKEIRNEIKEKVKVAVEEYNAAEEKKPEELKQKLKDIIEKDFVEAKVEEKEEEKVEKLQKTKEDEIRDRLRSFTRTIPTFIMANESKGEITIDNFDLEIDDRDFLDITSITKEEFHKLRDGFDYEENGKTKTFTGVFDKYRFNAAIAEFKLKKEELANYFTATDDIFELIPNQKTNQIFTPKRVVQMMINNLETHDPTLFTRTDSTFIDLYMKSGMYITEVVKKLFKGTRQHYENDEACLKHILENQVYGLAPTPILHVITQAYIFGFDTEGKISRKNFVQYDLTPDAQDGTAKDKIQQLFKLDKDMKFDAVVGNPPYQEKAKGESTKDMPIYPYFYEVAAEVATKYCLISPARFLFNAGSTDKKWNQKMLEDKHIKIECYEQDSSKIFPNNDIKGGVAILYRDTKKDFGAIGLYTSYVELNSINQKVAQYVTETLDEIISNRGQYRFSDEIYKDYPIEMSQISDRRIASNAFKKLPELFTNNKPGDGEEYIQIFGRDENERGYKWFKRAYLAEPETFEKYKVILPKANGSGAIGEILSTPLIGEPLIGEPLIGFTETFISIGSFDNRKEAENCLKYVKSKFARTMLGILKITQDNPRDKWAKVPLQDFTPASDIDWTKSISEIDRQLYKKYGLSEEEIAFIEEKIKPMD